MCDHLISVLVDASLRQTLETRIWVHVIIWEVIQEAIVKEGSETGAGDTKAVSVGAGPR